jgi:hypothetical protein
MGNNMQKEVFLSHNQKRIKLVTPLLQPRFCFSFVCIIALHTLIFPTASPQPCNPLTSCMCVHPAFVKRKQSQPHFPTCILCGILLHLLPNKQRNTPPPVVSLKPERTVESFTGRGHPKIDMSMITMFVHGTIPTTHPKVDHPVTTTWD